MENQFRMNSVPGALLIIGGRTESWIESVNISGWKVHHCNDLRGGQNLIDNIGPCIGLVDLTRDDLSLSAIAYLVSKNRQVRWMGYIKEIQLTKDPICQFIVNFCIDFFTAPMPVPLFLNCIGHQLGMLKLEEKIWPDNGPENQQRIVGDSLPIKRLREQIKRIASSETSVIISGSSGSGKSLIAKNIHSHSIRSKFPFVVVNCASLSEKRCEREVFGLDLESLPANFQTKLEEANEGTLLIKDITALPKTQQKNLLHFLLNPIVYTVKGTKPINVRLLVTSSNDIEQSVNDGDFNRDLFDLINVLRITVPPLK